jgi:ketosteroid isomerase-like protein
MHTRRNFLGSVIAMVVFGFASSGASAQATTAPNAQQLLTTLYAAITRGDSQTVHAMLGDEMRWVVGSSGANVDSRQLLAVASVPSPARFIIDSLQTHQYGATLILDYIRRDRWPLGDSAFTTSWRALAVFARRAGAWKLVRHTFTWLAQPVRAVAVDSSALQAFVGRYQIGPGYVDYVHWEAGQLVATASDQARGARLVPVSVSAFSPDGIGTVLMFERDHQGRVIGYVQAYPDGRVIRAPRLP